MNSQTQLTRYAPLVLRLGLSVVYMWFGVSQLMNASVWTGLVPSWATFMMSASTIVHLNGVFEIIAALLLVLGIAIRPVAGLLFIHLLIIAAHLGNNAIGVRDFGLSFATFAAALFGQDEFSWKKRSSVTQ